MTTCGCASIPNPPPTKRSLMITSGSLGVSGAQATLKHPERGLIIHVCEAARRDEICTWREASFTSIWPSGSAWTSGSPWIGRRACGYGPCTPGSTCGAG
jgi:hypothetical protein